MRLVGEINANSVYVRSGPGDNYYPTMKLDKGAKVVAVGQKFQWLKVAPPEGSFSYVAKVHVQRRGDGSVGRVARPDLLVRAGSNLNAMKTAIQGKLDENADVTIIGEQDEYFKIKPPADAYLYVDKRFVTLKGVEAPGGGGEAVEMAPAAPDPGRTAVEDDAADAAPEVTGGVETATAANAEGAGGAATQPASVAAELAFDETEAEFLTSSKLPLDQQPVTSLLGRYRELAKNNDLPASMRRIAEHRTLTLEIRAEALVELAKAKQADEEARQRALAMKAEREELEQRIKEQEIKVYTAVGTLRTSSLQSGREPMYRLTDPATGRTLVYLRTADAKLPQMVGQFIGVRGEVSHDPQANINVIAPTAFEAVEASQVPAKVAAQILPPSMLPKGPAAASVE